LFEVFLSSLFDEVFEVGLHACSVENEDVGLGDAAHVVGLG
jgi:hypothetical protein